MKILFWGSGIFCLAFCLHILIWNICIPRAQTKALLWVFFLSLTLSLTLIRITTVFMMNAGDFFPLLFSEYLHIILFFISLALAYIVTYSAFEVDGPSFFILMYIDKSKDCGLAEAEFNQVINDDYLVIPRVNDLVRDKLVRIEAGTYKLTTPGLMLTRLFIFYRRLLGVTQKGG